MSSHPQTNKALSECCDVNHEQFLKAVKPMIDLCEELEDERYREAGGQAEALLQMAAPDMLKALEAMDALGVSIWDTTSGDALVMHTDVPRLNAALKQVSNAVRKAKGLPLLVDD